MRALMCVLSLVSAVKAQNAQGFGSLGNLGSLGSLVDSAISQVEWDIPAYFQCNDDLITSANDTGE